GVPVAGGLSFPDVAQVRPPRLLKALTAACLARGVTILEHSPVVAIERAGERVSRVTLAGGARLAAPIAVDAPGSWAPGIAPEMAILPVKPIKGTIVLLDMAAPPTREILVSSRGSIYPRADRHVLLGATREDVGFDRPVRLEAVRALVSDAVAFVP